MEEYLQQSILIKLAIVPSARYLKEKKGICAYFLFLRSCSPKKPPKPTNHPQKRENKRQLESLQNQPTVNERPPQLIITRQLINRRRGTDANTTIILTREPSAHSHVPDDTPKTRSHKTLSSV
jgi:hypothetical protein